MSNPYSNVCAIANPLQHRRFLKYAYPSELDKPRNVFKLSAAPVPGLLEELAANNQALFFSKISTNYLNRYKLLPWLLVFTLSRVIK